MPFGTPGAYPIPSSGGPRINNLHQFQPDWAGVTDKHEYEDGGASYVLANDTAPIKWTLVYTGLSEAQAAVLDGHRNDAGGEAFGFDFTNPHTSTLYTGVHYDEEFEESHARVVWNQRRTVHLIKRPA